MVASSKKGIRASRSVARKPRPQTFFDAPLLLWIQQVPERIAVALPRFAGTPRFRRELLGVILIVIALLTAWVLGRGGDEGRLVAWWGETLVACCGRAAPLAPILVALAALRALSVQPGPILEIRHYLGGFGFGIAVVGLLQLGAGLNVPATGGYLGVAVATVALRFLGDLGAGLALFVVGVFAVFLLAGTDLQTFWDDLRALGRVFQRGLIALSVPIVRAVHAIRAIVIRRPTAGPSTTGENHPTPRDAASHAVASSTSSTVVINLPKQLRDQAAPPVVPEALPMKETARSRKLGATPPPDEIVPSPVASARASMLPLPDLSKLNYYDGVTPDTADLHVKARRIEDTLSSFKVEARVREINPGPAVTQFALEPGLGIKVRRITELQNDLALALAAPSIRIEAPIPGLARVGLEIPNEQIATVGLRETLESLGFTRSKAKLPIPLGRDVNGRYVVGDLTRMPHLLIAGATGSGKSVCLNGIISTFLLTRSPDDLKLLMIDPKMVELTGYNGVPHLQCPVVTEMDKVVGALRLTLREMERRYTLFSRLGVRNLDGYRMKVADEPGAENLPYLVVVIDELADLMMTAPDEVESLLVRLAQMARATGIHLIIATQRPSVDVLTGLIKANVPSRVAFAVSSLTDSRVILDMPGAERLLGRGDMLFLPPDAAKPQRIQGAFIEDKDAQYVVDHWHAIAPVPEYSPEWLELPSNPESDAADASDDPLMDQALNIVRQQGTASASMLQRRLRVGYNRAARLIEQMEDDGVIGPADGLRGRPVLVGHE